MQNLTPNDFLDIGSIVSIILTLIGGYYLVRGFWKSESEAIDIGVMRIAGDTPEENRKLPAVQDRLKLARDAKIGFSFLVAGSCAQIIFIALHRLCC